MDYLAPVTGADRQDRGAARPQPAPGDRRLADRRLGGEQHLRQPGPADRRRPLRRRRAAEHGDRPGRRRRRGRRPASATTASSPRSGRATTSPPRTAWATPLVGTLFVASYVLRERDQPGGPSHRPGRPRCWRLAGGGLALYTAWLGGVLVEEYGEGVKPVMDQDVARTSKTSGGRERLSARRAAGRLARPTRPLGADRRLNRAPMHGGLRMVLIPPIRRPPCGDRLTWRPRVLAHRALGDQPVEALLEGVAVGLLLGQDGGQLAGALGVADGLEGLDPGGVPVDRVGLGREVVADALQRRVEPISPTLSLSRPSVSPIPPATLRDGVWPYRVAIVSTIVRCRSSAAAISL